MEKKNCWMCGKEIDSEDRYCRHCGKKQDKWAQFPYTLTCAVLLFFIVGPFCLINVWRSPIIKRDMKFIFSVLVGVVSYAVMVAINNYINQYLQMFNI